MDVSQCTQETVGYGAILFGGALGLCIFAIIVAVVWWADR